MMVSRKAHKLRHAPLTMSIQLIHPPTLLPSFPSFLIFPSWPSCRGGRRLSLFLVYCIIGGAAGVPAAGGAKPKGGGSATRPFGLHQVDAGTSAAGMYCTNRTENVDDYNILCTHRMTVFQGRLFSKEGRQGKEDCVPLLRPPVAQQSASRGVTLHCILRTQVAHLVDSSGWGGYHGFIDSSPNGIIPNPPPGPGFTSDT